MKNEVTKLFPRGKKGINDISIIMIITMIFFATSIIIPFVNAEFSTNTDTFDEDNFQGLVEEEARDVSTVSAFDIIIVFFKLALFDWDNTLNLPFWLQGIYTVLALILILVIARNIWIGGGG